MKYYTLTKYDTINSDFDSLLSEFQNFFNIS